MLKELLLLKGRRGQLASLVLIVILAIVVLVLGVLTYLWLGISGISGLGILVLLGLAMWLRIIRREKTFLILLAIAVVVMFIKPILEFLGGL